MHEQICIKTNAWVDKEIAPIIEAMSSIDGLETFESCQEWYPGEASILFHYGNDLTNWRILGMICSKLAEEIRKQNIDYVHVSLEWLGSNDQPFGRLVVKPEYIKEVVESIQRLVVSIGFSESMALST